MLGHHHRHSVAENWKKIWWISFCFFVWFSFDFMQIKYFSRKLWGKTKNSHFLFQYSLNFLPSWHFLFCFLMFYVFVFCFVCLGVVCVKAPLIFSVFSIFSLVDWLVVYLCLSFLHQIKSINQSNDWRNVMSTCAFQNFMINTIDYVNNSSTR